MSQSTRTYREIRSSHRAYHASSLTAADHYMCAIYFHRVSEVASSSRCRRSSFSKHYGSSSDDPSIVSIHVPFFSFSLASLFCSFFLYVFSTSAAPRSRSLFRVPAYRTCVRIRFHAIPFDPGAP